MITKEHYYNKHGADSLDELLYESEPTASGLADFNRPKYDWSKKIYELMLANTWFPAEVNTAFEKRAFEELDENQQGIYKYTFAQLSFNDTAQTKYLADIAAHTNNAIVKMALIRQSWEEANHCESYAVLLDAAGNSDEVFNLYKYDDALSLKNERIAQSFSRYINGHDANSLLLSASASVALEGIYFLTGFSFIYSLPQTLQGAHSMIQFISRDELNTHLPLFANIYKTIRKENKIDKSHIDATYKMIDEAVDTELEYAYYLCNKYPLLGISEEILERTVKNYANDRLRAIGLEEIYPKIEKTYLQKLVDKNKNLNQTRTNFFEGNVKNYSKGSLDMNF